MKLGKITGTMKSADLNLGPGKKNSSETPTEAMRKRDIKKESK